MTKPLVSCVVSSYNRPRLIRDALDSILAQTWPNIQIIVADDWSDKPLCDVMREYELQFPSFIVPGKAPPTAHERRYAQRCSVCINAAMPYATGEFVCYLPDDDFLTPRSIEVRAQYLVNHPEVNAVYGRLEACKSSKPSVGIHYLPPSENAGVFGTRPSLPSFLQCDKCEHDRNGFWSAEPIARAANRVDHSMMMVRRVPNIIEGPLFNMSKMRQAELPVWPEVATAEALNTVSGLKREIRLDSGIGSVGVASCIEMFGGMGERFDCPDAGFFFRCELAGLGPFYSVDEVVTVKRYHSMHHRTDPSRRE